MANASLASTRRHTVRRLTRTEVLTYVRLLASAGNETTTRLIGWIGKVLSDHPDQLRQVAEDRSLVPRTVEEVLRFEAPSPVQARYVARDVEHHGRTVPEGSVMVLLNGSANRDERRFPAADVALDEVLQRWPGWEVDADNAIQARTSTVRGWEKLPVSTG